MNAQEAREVSRKKMAELKVAELESFKEKIYSMIDINAKAGNGDVSWGQYPPILPQIKEQLINDGYTVYSDNNGNNILWDALLVEEGKQKTKMLADVIMPQPITVFQSDNDKMIADMYSNGSAIHQQKLPKAHVENSNARILRLLIIGVICGTIGAILANILINL